MTQRTGWPLWCFWCDRKLKVGIKVSTGLYLCVDCYEALDAQQRRLEAC